MDVAGKAASTTANVNVSSGAAVMMPFLFFARGCVDASMCSVSRFWFFTAMWTLSVA